MTAILSVDLARGSRALEVSIFWDDFESASSCAWSATVGAGGGLPAAPSSGPFAALPRPIGEAIVGTCGDGVRTSGEECDDGNVDELDGCTSGCQITRACGAGAIPGGDAFTTSVASGHCYVLFDFEQTTFADAESACESIGGYLVTITDATEQKDVSAIANPAQFPWIGASDDINTLDNVFDWVTGEAWSYTNFAAGEPDDDAGAGGGGDCLALGPAQEWLDTGCNFVGFVTGRICELPPACVEP